MTWADFSTTAGQLGVLVALTGMLYRLMRLWWPDIPEAVMQLIAMILSSVTNLAVLYTPAMPKYQWLLLGLSSGVLMSQNVIKSIDWITSAKISTGAPGLVAERPPQWYVDAHPELFPDRKSAESSTSAERTRDAQATVDRVQAAADKGAPRA